MPSSQAVVSSGTLTRAQIREYARNAGFPENQLDMAVEVAMKESSGNPRATNSVPCYGLWQINMQGQMGVQRRKQLGIASNQELYNPAVNARAAKMIYSQAGNSWKPWTTANSARAALGGNNADNPSETKYPIGPGIPLPGGVSGGAVPIDVGSAGYTQTYNAEGRTGSAIDQLTEKLRLGMVTLLIFVVALVLLILGVVILNRQNAMKLATKFTPVGKVAKVLS